VKHFKHIHLLVAALGVDVAFVDSLDDVGDLGISRWVLLKASADNPGHQNFYKI
jgi:hypothetical protein